MTGPTGRLATVEIVHPEGAEKGSIMINESDFDPAVHTRLADAARKVATKPKKPASEDA
ncbi:MAG TPA: hypothetical protein VN607_02545 [Gemmatimonadaceae bacterium]|nr:hypothetical protein [Gemmatimonadaceae bacterium]